jgi:hypothetical protein
MRRSVGLAASFGVAALLATGLSVAPAGAAPLIVASPSIGASSVLAGYVDTTAPASATSVDTFTVPTIKCTSALSGVWAGAFVISKTGGLIGGGVFLVCQSGKPQYLGILQPGGTKTYQTTVNPAPGDSIKVSTTVSALSSKVSFTDAKRKISGSVTGSGSANLYNLDGIVALVSTATKKQLPVPSFGTVPFSAASENAKTLAAIKALQVDMETATKVIQIATGSLNATGNAFSEQFKHS